MDGTTLLAAGGGRPIRGRLGKRSGRATSTTTAIPTSCGRTRTAGRDLGNERDHHDRRRGRSVANPGTSWKAIGTGDFNGDGLSDILLQNTNGQVAIWEMNGTNMIGGGGGQPIPGRAGTRSEPAINGAASDILLQNTSGQAAIWEMDGTTQHRPARPWSPIPGRPGSIQRTGRFRASSGQTDSLAKTCNRAVAALGIDVGTTSSRVRMIALPIRHGQRSPCDGRSRAFDGASRKPAVRRKRRTRSAYLFDRIDRRLRNSRSHRADIPFFGGRGRS